MQSFRNGIGTRITVLTDANPDPLFHHLGTRAHESLQYKLLRNKSIYGLFSSPQAVALQCL